MYRILVDSKATVAQVFERTQNDDYNQGNWVVCKNTEEFMKTIVANLNQGKWPELISFEFNLGFDILDNKINPKAETGVDVIKTIVEWCKENELKLPEYLIHTEDQLQARNMRIILDNSKEIYKL